MNNDLRQQILVSLRAEGVGDADKAREAMAALTAEIRQLVKGFGEGTVAAADFKKEFGSLTGQLKFFDDYLASIDKVVQASEAMAIKEAERLAKLLTDYEDFLEKKAAAEEAAEIKEAERLAKLLGDYEAWLEKKAKSDEEAAAKKAATLVREQAAQDKADIAAIKSIQDRERAVAETSTKVNQLLAEDSAAHERHAAQIIEAETEIDRLSQKSAAAAVSRQLDQEKARRENAKAAMLQAREEQHFLDLLQEGVVMQDGAEKAIVKTTEAKKKGTEASNRFGYGLLHVSHAFQDLTYGIPAVLNNIPLIVQAFGGGPGLAGVAMASAVGVQLLSENLGNLTDAISTAEDPAKRLAAGLGDLKQKIADIEAKPHKIAVDFEALDAAKDRLTQMEDRLAAFNQAASEQTSIQEKVAAAVKNVIVEESGATDERAGAENLAKIIRTVRERQGTFFNGDPESERFKDLVKEQSVIKSTIESGMVPPEQLAGLLGRQHQLATDIPTLRNEIEKRQMERINAQIGSALKGEEAGRAFLQDAFEKNKDLFLSPRKGIAPVSPEFGQMIAEASGRAIRGIEAEDAADARQASMDDTTAFIKGQRNKRARAAAEEAKKQAAAAAKEQTERDQAISTQVNRFDNEFDQQKGPGSLNAQILDRIRSGQSNAAITNGLFGDIRGRLVDVPEEIVNDVVSQLIDKATSKIRAQVAAVGIEGIDAEAAEKLKRAQDVAEGKANRAAARGAKQLANENELNLARDIFNETGGQIGQQGAMAAAHRAMQSMQKGVDFQTATMEAIVHTMAQLSGMGDQIMADQMRINDQLNGVQRQLRMQGAQQRRNRAQRPSVLPFFGG